jgi:hypothetical protein
VGIVEQNAVAARLHRPPTKVGPCHREPVEFLKSVVFMLAVGLPSGLARWGQAMITSNWVTARLWSIPLFESIFWASVLAVTFLFSSQLALAQFTQQGVKLVGTGAVNPGYQGYSVALSADGNTAIVGGYGDNNFVGAAWVFTCSNGVWTQQGSKLVGTGAVGNAYQGPRRPP